jgi:hypothetical protein
VSGSADLPLLVGGVLVALGVGLAIGAGPRGREGAAAGPVAELTLAFALGAQALVLGLLALGLLGIPWTPGLLTGVGTAAWFIVIRRRRPGVGGVRTVRPVVETRAGALVWAGRIVLCGALALFLWKLAAAPLWSWDHYAMWGVKARRMITAGQLDLGFLAAREFAGARPDLPLGVPVLWRLLSLATIPGLWTFEATHALLACGLVAVVRAGVRRVGGAPAAAETLAALLVLSPLYWDTVGVGLADLPLAFWAACGLLLGLQSLEDTGGAAGRAGCLLGFLPWIKDEGLPLAAVLVLVLVLLGRGRGDTARRTLSIAGPALGLAGLAVAYGQWVLPSGYSFFGGDWRGRVVARLPELSGVLRHLGGILLDPAWLGLWPLVLLTLVAAVALRRRTPALLAGAVCAQLAVYLGVIVVAFPPPGEHLDASAVRFASVLVPLGVLAIGALLGSGGTSPLGRTRVTIPGRGCRERRETAGIESTASLQVSEL